MHGAHRLAGTTADQDAIPRTARVFATLGTIAGQQPTIHRPGQFTPRLGEGTAKREAAAGNQCLAADRRALGALLLALAALFGQGLLTGLFGFASLAGEGGFDGFEDVLQLGLILLAILEFLAAAGCVLVQFG